MNYGFLEKVRSFLNESFKDKLGSREFKIEADARIGVVVSLAYDSVYLLEDQIFPNQIGVYKNPLIVILNRIDLTGKSVKEIVEGITGGE
jgi:hypothetical protein